jgi:hypothetical protein
MDSSARQLGVRAYLGRFEAQATGLPSGDFVARLFKRASEDGGFDLEEFRANQTSFLSSRSSRSSLMAVIGTAARGVGTSPRVILHSGDRSSL